MWNKDSSISRGCNESYEQFKIGVMLKQVRESARLTHEEPARKLKTGKAAN
jgi:hypothetical protein